MGSTKWVISLTMERRVATPSDWSRTMPAAWSWFWCAMSSAWIVMKSSLSCMRRALMEVRRLWISAGVRAPRLCSSSAHHASGWSSGWMASWWCMSTHAGCILRVWTLAMMSLRALLIRASCFASNSYLASPLAAAGACAPGSWIATKFCSAAAGALSRYVG